MRVAVTGAAGFIGRQIVQTLLDKGHKVITIGESDPQIPGAEHKEWGLYKKVNVIVHCAGRSAQWLSDIDTEELQNENFALVNKAIAINPTARFVMMSSAEVYETDAKEFTSVEKLVPDDTRLLAPSALSAALCEHLLAQTKAETGNYYILRPRAVYGPGATTMLALVEPYTHGLSILPGKNPKSSFTNVKSLAEVAAFFVNDYQGEHSGIYNVADGSEEGTHDAIVTIATALGKDCTPIRIPYALAFKAAAGLESKARKKGDVPLLTRLIVSTLGRESVMDTTKLEAVMGYRLPPTDMSDAADWVN